MIDKRGDLGATIRIRIYYDDGPPEVKIDGRLTTSEFNDVMAYLEFLGSGSRFREKGQTVKQVAEERWYQRKALILEEALDRADQAVQYPHACDKCGSRYKQKGWLTRHINERHPVS